MITPEILLDGFALNLRIMQLQTAGLSHCDSLLQLPFRGNCMNWVLGHLLVNRSRLLDVLGAPGDSDHRLEKRYGTGSLPIVHEDEGVQRLEVLLERLSETQTQLDIFLRGRPGEDLLQINEERTLDAVLFGLYFHETYHTGQLEYLRQLAGADDAVI